MGFASRLLSVGLLAASACSSSDGESQPPRVTIDSLLDAGLGTASADSCPVLEPVCSVSTPPSFAKDVAPIIQGGCASPAGCHTGNAGDPWPLSDYGDIVDWSHQVLLDVQECTMPPPDAGTPLTPRQRLTIWEWLNCGTPE